MNAKADVVHLHFAFIKCLVTRANAISQKQSANEIALLHYCTGS